MEEKVLISFRPSIISIGDFIKAAMITVRILTTKKVAKSTGTIKDAKKKSLSKWVRYERNMKQL